MIKQNKRKLQEELYQGKLQRVDNMFLQEELSTMQEAIAQMIEQLAVVNLEFNNIEAILQLMQVCSLILDQISMNLQIQI